MPKVYDVGDDVTVTALFTGSNAAPVDPPAVILEVIDPDGIETDHTFGEVAPVITITNPTVGTFVAPIPATKAGIWQYRFRATGNPGKGSVARLFTVRRSDFV